MKFSSLLLLWQFSLFTFAASACDICGCYTASPLDLSIERGGFYAAIAEQFTRFGSIRIDGHEVDDPSGQYLNSSITQLIAGHHFQTPGIDLQINVPLIYRDYQRPAGFDNEHGTEAGLGDAALLARYRVLDTGTGLPSRHLIRAADGRNMVLSEAVRADFSASFHLLAGIKFPTGDSRRIREEFSEIEVEGAPESGIHGHDLTLGTGSYDALFGAECQVRYRSLFFTAETQFSLRGDGRHSYHFANDLDWSGGPGWMLLDQENRSFALQVIVSGEYKDTDRFQGRVAEDTGIMALYVGPQLTASLGRFSGELALDLPVLLENTALQAVPDYRIRAALTVRF